MKYITYIITIITILIYFSCQSKETKSLNDLDVNKLKKEIIESGDIESFKLLSMCYGEKKMDEDFLELSILMYEKYSYDKALSYIFYAYIYKYNPNVPFFTGDKIELFKKVPKEYHQIAIKYLEVGVSKGDFSCIEILSNYYLSIGEIDKSKDLLVRLNNLIQLNIEKVKDSLSQIKKTQKQ